MTAITYSVSQVLVAIVVDASGKKNILRMMLEKYKLGNPAWKTFFEIRP